jgi:RNA polymerase sigma-70 factor (ECF subfamily)
MSARDLPSAGAVGDEEREVRGAKQRDQVVWAAWHDRYFPQLYRYAFLRLSDKDEAEDIAAQVFLEALKGIDRFTYQGRPILAWLYGIANNLALKRRRQLARMPVSKNDEVGVEAGGSVEEEEATVQRLLVTYALEKLKKEHREVLVLRYLLDMPTKDVARAINKSEQATYSLLFRALQAAHAVLASGSEGKTDSRHSRRQVA